MDKLGYSVEEAGPILGVVRTTVFEKIATGELESVKIGRRRIIPADALRRFLDELRADQDHEAQPV